MADWRNRIVATDIKPASYFLANEKNWRVHPKPQQDALLGALTEVGWVQDVIVNRRSDPSWGTDRGVETLIDGHLRVSLALREGDDTPIPLKVVDLTPEEEHLILVSLDPITSMAIADTQKLDALLHDVTPSDASLQQMLSELAAKEGLYTGNGAGELEDVEPQIDRAAELEERWGTSVGQLWVIGSKKTAGKSHRLLCGDSSKAEDIQRLMAGQKAVLFATDPPYGVDYVAIKSGIPRSGYATLDQDFDDITSDDFKDEVLQAFLESVFRTWLPYLDHAGWYLWHAHLTQGFFAAAAAAAAADVIIHRQIIWVKSGFNLTRSGMYHWAHEPCFFGWVRGQQPPWYGEKNQRSVWDIDRHQGKGMTPTQKPVELWTAPMLNHTRPGDICAEPFAGSGSQFLAAEQHGRLCYGCDIAPKTIAVTLQRLADVGLQPQLVES